MAFPEPLVHFTPASEPRRHGFAGQPRPRLDEKIGKKNTVSEFL
jgi:hypothetical protein